MFEGNRLTAKMVWTDRAVFGVSLLAIGGLLGPGIGIVNAVLGPAAGDTAFLSWLDQAGEAPDFALVRVFTAIGLVLALRLTAGLLLAIAARIPGPAGVRAAWLSFCLTPPMARQFVQVIVSASLAGWTGATMSAPALAATQPTATVIPTPVPTPVLAPPEATVQTWPDLGRPGTAVPPSPMPGQTHSPVRRSWPDLGLPGTDVQPTPPPRRTTSPLQPSGRPSRLRPSPAPPAVASAAPATRPASSPPPRQPSGSTPPTEVVVAPGDCLWTLARHDLEYRSSSEPSASDIAAATQQWWRANRPVIGDNPDRLLPGERLSPPA